MLLILLLTYFNINDTLPNRDWNNKNSCRVTFLGFAFKNGKKRDRTNIFLVKLGRVKLINKISKSTTFHSWNCNKIKTVGWSMNVLFLGGCAYSTRKIKKFSAHTPLKAIPMPRVGINLFDWSFYCNLPKLFIDETDFMMFYFILPVL